MHFPDGIYVYGNRKFVGKCPWEKAEAVAFFKWLRIQYPMLGRVAIHIRNEGKRTRWVAMQHKKEGMVTGASDIIIPVDPSCPGRPPFVCELKRKDHTLCSLSEDQENYLMACKEGGAFVCIALGAEAAMESVGKWLEFTRKEIRHV